MSTEKFPFDDIPLLRERFVFERHPKRLNPSALRKHWAELYLHRYVANLVVGGRPEARAAFEALRIYTSRVESLMEEVPWDEQLEGLVIGAQLPKYKVDVPVDEALDDPALPASMRIEYVPSYSASGKFLLPIRAEAFTDPLETWELHTAGEWRAAKSSGMERQIHYRYYGSGRPVLQSRRAFALTQTLSELADAYEKEEALTRPAPE